MSVWRQEQYFIWLRGSFPFPEHMHKCWCRIKPTMNEFSSKAQVRYEIVFNIVVIFFFHCRTDSKGCKTEKLEIKVFLFRGDFILVLPLSSLIFLPASNLSHQSLALAAPSQKKWRWWQVSLSCLLLSPAMPCSQDAALGHSWLWGRYFGGVRETGAKSGKH